MISSQQDQQATRRAYEVLLTVESDAVNDADRRFYASYLLGHLSLISSVEHTSAQALGQKVNSALTEAFRVDRLSAQDKEGIRSLWQAISADIGLGL